MMILNTILSVATLGCIIVGTASSMQLSPLKSSVGQDRPIIQSLPSVEESHAKIIELKKGIEDLNSQFKKIESSIYAMRYNYKWYFKSNFISIKQFDNVLKEELKFACFDIRYILKGGIPKDIKILRDKIYAKKLYTDYT